MASPADSLTDDDLLAQQVADHLLAAEGTSGPWGVEIEAARVGYARLRMAVLDTMTNGLGTIHGGMIFALADTAFAYACNSRNEAAVAASASIIFLAPARVGEVLVAEAVENAVSGRTGSYSVAVRTADGRPVAQFQGQSRTIGGAVIELGDRENGNG
ncbi:MAG: hydroxyphenylacetyl-CoA thioesterase PaaI [Sphingobium sp.]